MNLKQSLLIAFILSAISITAWEIYWRNQGKSPNLDDNKDLWAVERKKVETADENDVIIIGSSRALFDIQLNEWEQQTGKRPIQLATAGASPLPVFHDLVHNTHFTGTIVVGVTPPLFFSTTFPMADPWKRAQSRVTYYQERTYAQQLNHILSIPLQQSFAFISTSEENWDDNIDLKTLLGQVSIGDRGIVSRPPFFDFGNIALDRNMKMTARTANDTAFANSIIKVWGYFGKNSPPPDKDATTAFFVSDAKTFLERGGKIVLLRSPSTGGFRMGENMMMPRAEFWDPLVSQVQVPSYHFEDYEEFKTLTCPEESHLSEQGAQYFTTEFVKLLLKEGHLSNAKSI